MSIKKTKIVFDFDFDSLKELRKILFAKGLTPQQFLYYVVELVAMHDLRMEEIMIEAMFNKEKYRGKLRANTADAETIYEIIKQELDDTKNRDKP